MAYANTNIAPILEEGTNITLTESEGVIRIDAGAGGGTVTSVSFTGGLISVANATTTPALTVAGTSGGIPYFSSASTWASSGVLAANSLMVGGGAGAAPSTVTTGANILTALGIAVGSSGAPLVGNTSNSLGASTQFASTVSTGTGATAGMQIVGNSLTTGNLVDISTSSLTSGRALSIASTSTAINHTAGTNALFSSRISGANANSGRTAIAGEFVATNTGTSPTNIGIYSSAANGINNYAGVFVGDVLLNRTTKGTSGSILDMSCNVTYQTKTIYLSNVAASNLQSFAIDGGGRFYFGALDAYIGSTYGTGGDLIYNTNQPTGAQTSTNHKFTSTPSLNSASVSGISFINATATFTTAASGTDARVLDLTPIWNTVSASGNNIGIDYNSTNTSHGSRNHLAWRNTSGNFLINGSTITASTVLDVRGQGTTTANILRLANSANTERFTLKDNGVTANTQAASGSTWNGTWTATTANEYNLTFGGTFVGSSTGTNSLGGYAFNPTLVANANNQTLSNVVIGSTFTNGAFTGVQNYDFYVTGVANPAFAIGRLASNIPLMRVTGTFPSTGFTSIYANNLDITGAGTASNVTGVLRVGYNAGYTGASATYGIVAANASAGTSVIAPTMNATFGNSSVATFTSATTTGHNYGGVFQAFGGNLSVGILGETQTAKNSATNIGVAGLSLNTGTSPQQIGGYFALVASGTSLPTSLSAALIANNGSTTNDIFKAQDNGIDVVFIADGGLQTNTAGINLSGGALTLADAVNMVFNTTTGTKIGTATSQKIGFWNATPIIQPTTGVAAATFTANTSAIANDTATFDGYTIGQIVKALRNIGLLA